MPTVQPQAATPFIFNRLGVHIANMTDSVAASLVYLGFTHPGRFTRFLTRNVLYWMLGIFAVAIIVATIIQVRRFGKQNATRVRAWDVGGALVMRLSPIIVLVFIVSQVPVTLGAAPQPLPYHQPDITCGFTVDTPRDYATRPQIVEGSYADHLPPGTQLYLFVYFRDKDEYYPQGTVVTSIDNPSRWRSKELIYIGREDEVNRQARLYVVAISEQAVKDAEPVRTTNRTFANNVTLYGGDRGAVPPQWLPEKCTVSFLVTRV